MSKNKIVDILNYIQHISIYLLYCVQVHERIQK